MPGWKMCCDPDSIAWEQQVQANNYLHSLARAGHRRLKDSTRPAGVPMSNVLQCLATSENDAGLDQHKNSCAEGSLCILAAS